MTRLHWIVTPIAILGSGLTVAITLLHYIHAHRLGVPGGYLPLVLGAGVVACLAGLGAATTGRASKLAVVVIALIASLATAGILVATLVLAFGS